MEILKNFFSKPINIFGFIIIIVALIFGGWKAYISANIDTPCTYVVKKTITLKDQTHTSCQDIVWGGWKKVSDNKEIRKGVGIRTIIDYRKTKTQKIGSYSGKDVYDVKRCFVRGYGLNPSNCKIFGGYWWRNGCRFKNMTGTTVDGGSQVDTSLRNDTTAKIYKTNILCKVVQTRTDDKTDPVTDDPTDPVTDDPTDPNSDDPTDPKKWIDTGVDGKRENKALITSDLMWSTDRVHWHDNFDQLILLKNKDEKVYLKTAGSCSDGSKSFFKTFKFNFMHAFMAGKDQAKNFLNLNKKEEVDGGILIETQPNNDAPYAKVFSQKLSGDYCGGIDKKERSLNIKIVNPKREEI